MRPYVGVAHQEFPEAAVASLRVSEGLSTLFEIEAVLIADDPDVDLEKCVGTTILFELKDLDAKGSLRFFHGEIEDASYWGERESKFLYRLRARPTVFGLTRRVRSRTFQEKSAPEIIKEVLKGAGVKDDAVAWKLSASYPKRDLCVQYRESELSFVLRLLEEEGIFYWFEHSQDGHVMKLGDDPGCHEPISGEPTLPFTTREQSDREAVTDLVQNEQVGHDLYFSRDWTFHSASRPLQAEQKGPGPGAFECYEYPGRYQLPKEGLRLSQVHLEEALASGSRVSGKLTSWRLEPGRTFTLQEALPDFLSGDHLLTRVEHVFKETQAGAGPGQGYRAFFEAMPADRAFRPARTTPRPRISGRESAVVTGPAGEEIHVDEYGRIKVHFYWDREGKTDDKASCWIRVQQQNTSGSMILPRVGWEVSVGFLHGDPDRPVVLQKLYNQETMPPYALPDHKTSSSLQSSSSPGGGGTNEIRLQDGSGGMEFFVHAAKDFAMGSGNDLGEDITVDAHEEVGLEMKTTVGADEEVSIGAKQKLSVGGDSSEETKGDKNVTVGTDDWGVGGLHSLTCDGARSDSIGGMMNVLANSVSETFNSDCTRTVGAALSINSATAIAETVAGSKTEMVGGAKLELIRKAKAETVGTTKILNTGFMLLKSGKDVGHSAKAGLAITVVGAIAEKVGGGFNITARAVMITAPGGLKMKAGGSEFNVGSGKVEVKASSLGGKGGPQLQLSGNINYK